MSEFLINKSGSTIPVYNSTGSSKAQIGTLANREAFSLIGFEGDFYAIYFLSSSGMKNGYLINPPNNACSDCTAYPYGTVSINGTTYKTFKFRRSSTVYTAGATKWGTVASNCRVACSSALSGQSHPDWKAINYVESTNGTWVQVTGDGSQYGFVDTGLSVGSGPSTISMYGTW